MTGVSSRSCDPRNSAEVLEREAPAPPLAGHVPGGHPSRPHVPDQHRREGDQRGQERQDGPSRPEGRPALRREPEVESQTGQDEEHRVLRETPDPDREPQEEPRDRASSREGPLGGPQREGPRDDERRVDGREEAARPDERRELETDHGERSGLGSPEQLAAEPVDRPRADEAQEDGAEPDAERGGPEHGREPGDEIRDERALRVVREIEPARPLPVVRLVRREVEAAPGEEGDPEPRQDGQDDGDEEPHAAPRPGRARLVHPRTCGRLEEIHDRYVTPSMGDRATPRALSARRTPGSASVIRRSVSRGASRRTAPSRMDRASPTWLSGRRHPARRRAPGLGSVGPGRLDPRVLAEVLHAVRALPGELGLAPSEVSEGGGLPVDRPAEVQVLDDARGGEIELALDQLLQLALGSLPVPNVSTMTDTGSTTPMA